MELELTVTDYNTMLHHAGRRTAPAEKESQCWQRFGKGAPNRGHRFTHSGEALLLTL
jgi:hypothetical protein